MCLPVQKSNVRLRKIERTKRQKIWNECSVHGRGVILKLEYRTMIVTMTKLRMMDERVDEGCLALA